MANCRLYVTGCQAGWFLCVLRRKWLTRVKYTVPGIPLKVSNKQDVIQADNWLSLE